MQVILLESDKNLGELGSIVNVKAGYARNYLIPKNKAKFANKDNLAFFEQEKEALIAKAGTVLEKAKQQAEEMANIICTIATQVGEEGKLFGSVGTTQIVNALANIKYSINKQDVKMPDGVIRHVGEYDISIVLHSEVSVTIRINVIAA